MKRSRRTPNSTLILFATLMEAEHTLQKTAAKAISEHLFESSVGPILITGMGAEKSKATLLQHIDNYDHFINFGIVGTLKPHFPQYSNHTISFVTNHDESRQLSVEEQGLHLYTSLVPLYDTTERDRLSKKYDLVDMEGFVFTDICQAQQKTVHMHKIVSDFCDQDTHTTIKQKFPYLSELLYNRLKNRLGENG